MFYTAEDVQSTPHMHQKIGLHCLQSSHRSHDLKGYCCSLLVQIS